MLENIAYIIFFTFAGCYVIAKSELGYFITYFSIALGLFIPLFAMTCLANIIKSLIEKEKPSSKKITLALFLSGFQIIIYYAILDEMQRVALYLFNTLSCVVLVIWILVKKR